MPPLASFDAAEVRVASRTMCCEGVSTLPSTASSSKVDVASRPDWIVGIVVNVLVLITLEPNVLKVALFEAT